MKRLLPLLLPLAACAPQVQPVQVWEGTGRVLLREQSYRLTFTVNDQTHDLRGQLENRSSGDTFLVKGTYLPLLGEAEITAEVTAGSSTKLGASIFGVGISGISLKSDALLSGRVVQNVFNGNLRVNGISYPVTLNRVK